MMASARDIRNLIEGAEADFPPDVVLYAINGHYRRIIKTAGTVARFCRVGKVLDVGPGFGVIPRLLQKLGFDISVLDYQIDERRALLFKGFGYKCLVCDASLDPFPVGPGTLDVVLLSEVIEHVYVSPKGMLVEIQRILKPGGVLVVTTPNFVNLRKRLWMLMGKSPMEDISRIYERQPYERHAHEYTMKELVSVITWSGMQVIHQEFVNLMAFQTPAKNTAKEQGLPQCDRAFRLNSTKQWMKIPYLAVATVIPSLRDTLLVVARKSN